MEIRSAVISAGWNYWSGSQHSFGDGEPWKQTFQKFLSIPVILARLIRTYLQLQFMLFLCI